MSERENRTLNAPEQFLNICKAEATDEDEVLKTHIIENKVKSELDVSIKLLSDIPVKEEFTRGDFVETHESLDSIKKEQLENHHCRIPASNDMLRAGEATYFKIEVKESVDFKTLDTQFEEIVEIGKQSLDVEGYTKVKEESGVEFRLEGEKKTILESLGSVSTESQSEFCSPAFPEGASKQEQYLKFCKEENSEEPHISKTYTFKTDIENDFNSEFQSLKDINYKLEIKEEKIGPSIDLVPTNISVKVEQKHLCFEEQPNRISSATFEELISVPGTTSFRKKKNAMPNENSDGYCKTKLNMKIQSFESEVSKQSSSDGRYIKSEDDENKKDIYMKRTMTQSRILKHCTEQTTIKTDFKQVLLKEKQTNSNDKFTCKFVKDGTKWFQKVKYSKLKPLICDVRNNRFSDGSTLVSHKRTHTKEKPFNCDVCNKRFYDRSNLVRHKRTHTKERPYTCDDCNKSFSQTSHLVSHKRTHTKERPFTCEFCNKGFSHGSTLVIHKRTHTKERPFTCVVCNKRFSRIGHLISHTRTHTKERPFTCDVCNKRFSHGSTLVSHIRTHTKEKPFNCDVCNKRFSHGSALVNHKRTHTKERPFTCDVCNKSFSQTNHLVSHKRTHTKERPFTCDVCNKRFSHGSTLVSHKRTHTKEKHFTCNVCNKIYSSKSYLRKHLLIHFKY